VSSDPAGDDRDGRFRPLTPEEWAQRLSQRSEPLTPSGEEPGTGDTSEQAASTGEPEAPFFTAPDDERYAATNDVARDYQNPADAAGNEHFAADAGAVPPPDAVSPNAVSPNATPDAVTPDAVPWPDETAGTAEAAIVSAATNPLVYQRLSVWKDELLAWFRTLLSAAVYATLIVTFGFQVARVEGQSMAPTLADQDRLIVNKLAYRLGPPRRDDIVMLYYPVNPDKSFVKRVIAEEGDTVKIEDGRVYVNDVPLNDDDYVPEEFRSHDDYPAQVIKEGYYYVLGDHRNNSSDSRHWGEVPKKYIIGRVWLRWWPIPNARIF
jgi:signal peptidase I